MNEEATGKLKSETGDGLANSQSQNSTKQKTLDIGKIYDEIVGPHGVWQVLILLFVCCSTPAVIYFPVFVNAVPKFRCRMQTEIEDALSGIDFHSVAGMVGPWMMDQNDDSLHRGLYGCVRYKMNSSITQWKDSISRNYSLNFNKNETESCLDGYIYDPWPHQYPSTIVQEWDLVCSNHWKGPFSSSMLMVGMMVGYVFGGFLGNSFGRSRSAHLATIFEAIFGLAVTFSKSFAGYVIFRSLLSMFCTVKITSVCVLFVEITNSRYRSVFHAVWSIYISFLARVLQTLIAMYLHKWRILHLLIMLPSFIGVVLLAFLPESPRWLQTNGKFNETVNTLYIAHRINHCYKKSCMTRGEFHRKLDLLPYTAKKKRLSLSKSLMVVNSWCGKCTPASVLSTLTGSFRTPYFVRRSLLSIGIFAFQLCTYFGIIFYAQIVRSSVYVVTLTNSLAVVPATIISMVTYNRVSSRKIPLLVLYSMSATLLLIGGAYSVIAQPTSELPIQIIVSLVLVFLGSSINMLFIFIPELFPVTLRTQALGISSGLGRVGSILSSFINELDLKVRHGVPLLVYGCLLALQLGLVGSIPDTTGAEIDTPPPHEDLEMVKRIRLESQ